jgi:hypothetical protein
MAAAIPLLAGVTPAGTVLLRACGHRTAAKNVTGMVIIRASPRDYLSGPLCAALRDLSKLAAASTPNRGRY